MKKYLSILLIILIILLSFIGCKNNVPILKIYMWGEFISNGEDNSIDVKKEFEKKYNIKVSITNFSSNEEMYAKIKSGSLNYDLIIPSDYMINRMIKEDMLEKIDFNNISNFDNIMPHFKNPNYDPTGEYSVPYMWGMVGIVYNKDIIKNPTYSWDMLWDEQYKKNILMFNNSRDAFGLTLKYLGYSQNTTNLDEITEVYNILKKQRSIIQAYVMDEIFDKMSSNEAIVAPYYVGDAYNMIQDNSSLDVFIPREGTNMFVDAMVIPKGAKLKKEAELFINFMMEPEIAKANVEYTSYSTPNQKVYEELPFDVKNNNNLYPSAEFIKTKTNTFLDLPKEITSKIDEFWLEVKLGYK